MAVSGVKARLMLFEAAENNNMVAERKDSKGEPPALQKFRQNQQQLQDNKSGEGRPPVAQKPGQFNLRQNSKTEAESDFDSAGNGGGGVGKINVAKMFQQGSAPPPLRPVVPFKKPGALNSETSTTAIAPDVERPKVALKPPNKAWSPSSPSSPGFNSLQKTTIPTEPQPGSDGDRPVPRGKPPSTLKSSLVTANGGGAVTINQLTAPVKLPTMDGKPVLKKTESSISSASSSSSASSKHSTSSLISDNTNGPIDFRSRLKSRPSLGGNTEATTISNSTTNSSKDLSPSEPSGKPDPVKRPSTSDNASTDEIVERQSDCKRFKKVKLSSLPPEASDAPEKPALPEGGVDLTLVCQQHAAMLHNMSADDLPPPPPPDDEEEEDIYEDGSSAVESRQPSVKSQRNRESGRASMIPEMTAEEEGLEEEIYDDGQTPQEDDLLYVDAASETKPAEQEEEDFNSVYEDESDVVRNIEESEEAKKIRLKDEAEAKKREQKRLKEEEKKKNKDQKEQQKRRKKFNLTGDETNVGEGTIKEDAKGRNNNLTVRKGEKVTIVRLDNNPANKFLVKTDTDMGYVDSSNIEIDAEIIRKAMVDGKKDSASNQTDGDDCQPVYDDVAAGDNAAQPVEVEEEIYQCVE